MKIIILFLLFSVLSLENAEAINLKEVIQHTLQTNPSLQLSNSKVLSKKHLLAASYATLYPSLDFSLVTGFLNDKTDKTLSEANRSLGFSRNIGLIATQNLFSGGSSLYGISKAKSLLNEQRFNTANTKIDIILSVVNTYFDEIRLKKLIILSHENIINHKQTLKKILYQLKHKMTSKSDKALAKAKLSLAEIQSHQLVDEKKVVDSDYIALTGISPGLVMDLPLAPTQLPKSLDTAIKNTNNTNPLLKELKSSIMGADDGIKIEKAKFYPRLSLEVSAYKGLNATGSLSVAGDKRKTAELDALVTLSYNIFNGGSDYQALENAAELRNQKKFLLYQTQRNIKKLATTTWKNMISYHKQMALQKMYKDEATAVLKTYNKQFTLGKRSLFELLDAENDLYSAESLYINLYLSYRQSQIDLAIITTSTYPRAQAGA